MQALVFALRNIKRDWKSSELRVLTLALIVAVAAVTAVSFFTNRIHKVMEWQAAELLGADLRLSSYTPLNNVYETHALQQGLHIAHIQRFSSVVLKDDETVLVSIKAVDDTYPLRGKLRIAEQLDSTEVATTTIPASGHIWLEPSLLQRLALNVGDHLTLGEAEFVIANVLTYEPDRTGSLFQLAPRILMNVADVEKTGLIGFGSRVRHRLLIAGDAPNIAAYREWITPQLTSGEDLQGVEDGRPELRMALERAEQFLGLAALVAVILAGAAVAVAARYFAQRQADASAIMRCLGATQRLILHMYLVRILFLGLVASFIGSSLGWLAQHGLATMLANFLTVGQLPTPDFSPVLLGFAVSFSALLGFALPPILRIHTVSPLRVLRHEIIATPLAAWQTLAIAMGAMGLLLYWQAGDPQLALYFIVGSLITLLALLALAYALVYSLRFIRGQAGLTWKFGLANLARRAQNSSIQLIAFGLGIMALLLLAIVRVDLLNSWQDNLPNDTPNRFVLNIQPHEITQFQQFLHHHLSMTSALYPVAIGRFLAINGKPVLAENYTNFRAQRFAKRTFNLSSANALPSSNQLVSGVFWDGTSAKVPQLVDKTWLSIPQQLSVEQGFADTMGITLGDTLQFRFAGQNVEGKVTSLRKVQWDSFQVNFFILASPDLIANLPKAYLTSFYLPENKTSFISELVRQFPSVTVVDTGSVMEQVRQIMQRATLAVEYVFLFTLLAGLMVLYAAISASQEERYYETAILRTLGATRSQVLQSLFAEFLTLGGLAGLLAAFMASGLGYLLATHIFALPYQGNVLIWLIGIVGGAFGIGIAGIVGTLGILKKPPLEKLRLGI